MESLLSRLDYFAARIAMFDLVVNSVEPNSAGGDQRAENSDGGHVLL